MTVFSFLLKVRLVNQLYNTNIKAEDKIAQRITNRNSELAPLLASGSATVVEILAECGIGRKEQVFASKFAAFHRPALFAIGDKYVDLALEALTFEPWNRGNGKGSIAENYDSFRRQVIAVGHHHNISLREADHYLWLKGQKQWAAIEGTSQLNGEVKWSMENSPNLWNRL